MIKSWYLRLALGGCLLALAGCSDSLPVAPTVGTITYKQQPVAEADVAFIPASGRPAYGRTDDQGRFQLTTLEPADGAMLGAHTVTVTKSVQKGSPSDTDPYVQYQSLLPERYSKPQESPLKADVVSGEANDFSFELTDK